MGKQEGRQGRGRQGEHMIDRLAAWMNIENTSEISTTEDRGVGKGMVANNAEQSI